MGRNVAARITRNNEADVSVCILDTGVNYNNPLLSRFTNSSLAAAWDISWPLSMIIIKGLIMTTVPDKQDYVFMEISCLFIERSGHFDSVQYRIRKDTTSKSY